MWFFRAWFYFRQGAHIIALTEAHDHGGIQKHEKSVCDNAMLGMVVHAEIPAPSVAIFVSGTHADGKFVELLPQYQYETAQKTDPNNNSWIFHGCVFRISFGQITYGEMVGPGIRTTLGSDMPTTASASSLSMHLFHQRVIFPINALLRYKELRQSKLVICLNGLPVQISMMCDAWAWQNAAVLCSTYLHSLGKKGYQEVCGKMDTLCRSSCLSACRLYDGRRKLFRSEKLINIPTSGAVS